MSLDAMPQLPAQMIPRIEKLVEKVRSGEVSSKDIMGAYKGPVIRTVMPAMMTAGGQSLAQITPIVISKVIPGIIGKKLFIRLRGSGCYIFEIGYLPKILNMRPATPEEIAASGIPGVDLDPEILILLMQGYIGIAAMVSEGLIRIYGFDVIAGWLGGEMMNLILPVIDILTRNNMEPIQDVLVKTTEEVLSKYGM